MAYDTSGDSTVGEIWSFATIEQNLACGDLLIDDRDGQSYNTVQIGTQCWMAENLNIGLSIYAGNDQTNNGIIEKYCHTISNCDIYGGLYQWNEMMQYTTIAGLQGICPEGWHLPTNSDWDILSDYLGGTYEAGGKMKETGTTHWNSPNTGATNSSGFTGYGGGYRSTNSYFYAFKNTGFFWTSNQVSSPSIDANNRYLWHDNANISDGFNNKNYGFSVRCMLGEINNQPPIQPSNPNPHDGSTNISNDTLLSWSCSDLMVIT